ncbi:MAG: DUF2780 domain-containing protein [Candidatus Krumholzibacteria bacterium]|nr:DUF2780 domain-containing protein [Candidatus Krumholzibacteria bacterium]
MELLDQLTKGLGITEEQAKGGAGLIFKMAKSKLGEGDFAKVSGAVPGIGDLLKAAPSAGGLGGAIGGLASMFGGKAGKLGDLAGLAGGFSKLGLDSEMVGKFVPIIISFVQAKGGAGAADLLQKILKK